MSNFKQKIAHEINVFNQLENSTKSFLFSLVGYGVSDILLFTFGYALIFLKTNSVIAVGVFNLAFYLTIIAGFYLNGMLLTKISAKRLFIGGGLAQGLVMSSLFFIPISKLWQVAIFGLIYGVPLGIYWGNRNRLYLYFTNDHNRHYFEGLRRLISDPLTAVGPLLAGWSIVFFQNLNQNSGKTIGYQLIAIISLSILTVSMFALKKLRFPKLQVNTYKLNKISHDWRLFRYFVIISSFQFALVLSLPEILTLKYLGNEGVLGTLKMSCIILASLMLYVLGKRAQAKARLGILKLSALPLIMAAGLVFLKTNPITIIIYLLTMAVSDSVFWFVYFPILSKAVEKETVNNAELEYAYIFDHEIWINLGRTIATLSYFFVVYVWGDHRGIMSAIVAGAIMQLVGLSLAKGFLPEQKG